MDEARRKSELGMQLIRNHSQPQQIQVDISKSPPLACACGCTYFVPAVTVHMISALISPTGQELMAQVPVLICLECKSLLPPGAQNK